jgi:hypothetical protein
VTVGVHFVCADRGAAAVRSAIEHKTTGVFNVGLIRSFVPQAGQRILAKHAANRDVAGGKGGCHQRESRQGQGAGIPRLNFVQQRLNVHLVRIETSRSQFDLD